MKKEGMNNGVIAMENKITVGQNSKGFWSCKEITVYGKTRFEMIKELDDTMTETEIILQDHNSEEEVVKEDDD